MKRRQFGTVDVFTLGFAAALLLTGASGQAALLWVDLKSGPADSRELVALGICFAAGCTSQLFFLMSRVGADGGHPWARWIGEIALGGVAAYVVCVGYLRYGPDVALTTLIMIAALGGFAGQRALVWVIDWVLKKFGVASPSKSPEEKP